MCLISVIVPIYNTKEYLDRCILSVLKQTFQDYELILVDDGSSDGSEGICDTYASKYNQVRVIHQNNKGLATSRKVGATMAKGEYVFFLDSDDWILDTTLEVLYRESGREQLDMIVGQHVEINENGKEKEYRYFPKERIVCHSSSDFIYHIHVTRFISPSAWGKLIRTKLLQQIDFKDNLAIGEEHDMITQIAKLAKTTIILKDKFYFYFMRGTGISRSGYNEKYKNSLYNYIAIRKDLVESHPKYKLEINAFYCEFEMAIITAMSRNRQIDMEAIQELQEELKESMKYLLRSSKTSTYLKGSAVVIVCSPKIFMWIYSYIYRILGSIRGA